MEPNRKQELLASIKKTINEEMDLNEMAQISGKLKDAIDAVIASKSDLSGLELKKAIKADADVITALDGETLHDNQLNRFISLAKGETTLGTRGRKAGEKVTTLGNRVDKLSPENQAKIEKVVAKMEKPVAAPAAAVAEPELAEVEIVAEGVFNKMQRLAGLIKG